MYNSNLLAQDTSLLAQILKLINNSSTQRWKSFTGVLKCNKPNGSPQNVDLMQTADRADWVLFSNTWLTFFCNFQFHSYKIVFDISLCLLFIHRPHRTNSTSDCWFNKRITFNRLCMENFLYWSSINILKLSVKIKFHTFWAQIASIFGGFVVCDFISFVQFVVVFDFFSLRSTLKVVLWRKSHLSYSSHFKT